ncbi:MAG: hypothetical protein ACHQIM_03675 [Sphingobacteriales bacterium]
MSQIREIKCPHCGEWTLWNGDVDDRCLFCGEFLEPKRFSREVEKQVNRELLKENDYFFIKPGDGDLTRWFKSILNQVRWLAYYVQIAFFIFVTLLLVLLSLITG